MFSPYCIASSSLDRLSMDSSAPVSVLLQFLCHILHTVSVKRKVLSANDRMLALTRPFVIMEDIVIVAVVLIIKLPGNKTIFLEALCYGGVANV